MTRPSGRYAAHASFIVPALSTPGVRPVILGFVIVETLYRTGQQLFGYALDAADPDFAETVFDGTTAPGLLLNLMSFAILGLALALVLRLVHGLGLRTLLGPLSALLPQAGASFAAVLLAFAATEAAFGGFDPGPDALYRPLAGWLVLLVPALVALTVQTGCEELFYRGYLQQRVAALFPHPAAWLIVPNLAFALAHFDAFAPAADNLAYLAWTFCFGVAASDLVARAGGLGPALGLHLANNAFAFLIFGETGAPDSGLALILYPTPESELFLSPASPLDNLPAELAVLALTWGAARLALRR